MSDIAELHAQALDQTGRVIAGIKPGQWHADTPCDGWDVHALLNHLVAGNLWAAELGAGATIEGVGDRLDGDVLGADPAAAYAASAAAAAATFRRPGADYQRVVADGQAYFVKRLIPATHWIMRVTGDSVHRPYLVWRAGIMDKAPSCIDHTVVAMEVAGTGHDATLSVLMRDVGACLVPPGDAQVPLDQHDGFLTHMAALAAAFWGWQDDIG